MNKPLLVSVVSQKRQHARNEILWTCQQVDGYGASSISSLNPSDLTDQCYSFHMWAHYTNKRQSGLKSVYFNSS